MRRRRSVTLEAILGFDTTGIEYCMFSQLRVNETRNHCTVNLLCN